MHKEWIDRPLGSAIRYSADLVYFSVGLGAYFVLYFLFRQVLSVQLVHKLSNKKVQQLPMHKYNRALWKVFCYTLMFAWGVYTFYGDTWMFSAVKITFAWPNNDTPWQVHIYYILETVYYTGSFVTMFFEEKQSDFVIMAMHHIFTLSLIGFSYTHNFLRYGTVIMALHDIADPWMEAAKLSVYFGHQTVGNVLFLVFTFVFIIPRVVVYVFLILIPGYSFLWDYGSTLLVPIWSLLVSIFLLNVYWSTLILRMLFGFIFRGKVDKDIRDVGDDDSKGNKSKVNKDK